MNRLKAEDRCSYLFLFFQVYYASIHYEKYFSKFPISHLHIFTPPPPSPSPGRVCRKAAAAATVWTNLPRLAEWRKVAVTGDVDHMIPYSVGAWCHTVSSSHFIQVVVVVVVVVVDVGGGRERGGGRGGGGGGGGGGAAADDDAVASPYICLLVC